MQIEKTDRVVIGVRDVDKAQKFFSELLGMKFDRIEVMLEGRMRKAAISPQGLELVDILPEESEGLRVVHFKVSDLYKAKSELERRGIRIEKEMVVGGLKELIIEKEDCHGVRIGLIAYDVPHGAVIAAGQ